MLDPFAGIAFALLHTHAFKVVQADVAFVILVEAVVQIHVHLRILKLLFHASHDAKSLERVWKEFRQKLQNEMPLGSWYCLNVSVWKLILLKCFFKLRCLLKSGKDSLLHREIAALFEPNLGKM